MFCSLLGVTCSRMLQIPKKWKWNTLTLLSASRSDEETLPLSRAQRTETASVWSGRQQCDLSCQSGCIMHERPFISAGGRGASIIIICCLGYACLSVRHSAPVLECSTGGATPHGWWNKPLMHAWQLKAASGAGLRSSLFSCSIVPIHWSQDPPAASGNVKVFM